MKVIINRECPQEHEGEPINAYFISIDSGDGNDIACAKPEERIISVGCKNAGLVEVTCPATILTTKNPDSGDDESKVMLVFDPYVFQSISNPEIN
jgi:hypothetical protein